MSDKEMVRVPRERLQELLDEVRHQFSLREDYQERDHAIELIEAMLDAATAEAEHLAPVDDPKAKRRCKCEFSSGGVWAKKCAFHADIFSKGGNAG